MTKVYIDSTLQHDWNVNFNLQLCQKLEESGIDCYLPQRNTNQQGEPVAKFKQNISGIKETDVLLAVSNNESPNWGVEIGFAHGQGKRIVLLTTNNHPVPLMAEFLADKIVQVEDLDDISSYVGRLVSVINQP